MSSAFFHHVMKNFFAYFVFFGIVFFPCSARCAAGGTERPNFVVILVDDLGWADLGCYGSSFHETPRLDRMSREGLKFTNAYAASAVCSPSRAALQTGLCPARTGITDWIRGKFQGGVIPPDGRNPVGYVSDPKKPLLCPKNKLFLETEYLTVAEHLKANGYATGHVGKWHLGQEGHTPLDQGYDVNVGGCDLGQPPSYFDPYESNRPDYHIPKDSLPPRKAGEYLTDREADEAANFIRQHKDRPFFLHLAHYAVHTPLQAKKDRVEKYRAKLERMKAGGEEPLQKNAVYAAMVESVDDAVGTILDTLVEEGISERTYVFFTSDNGGLSGPTNNAPLRSGKGFPYEGGIREPLIVWAPGRVGAGAECGIPTITMDFFPTLCDLAEIPLPETDLDGMSIRPLWLGERSPEVEKIRNRTLFWHFPHYRGNDPASFPYSIVRHDGWKLIRFDDDDRIELYRLVDDPGEKKNVAGEHPEIVRQLVERLEKHLDHVGAKRVKPNPEYRKEK